MPFRPCPSGCGRFLSADDGHDRCLQCLPASRSMEPPCVAPGRDAADLSGLPPAVVETIILARDPSTRQTYALKWSLFATWCSSRREDPRRCMMQELRTATDFALRATKVTARSLGKAMSTMVVLGAPSLAQPGRDEGRRQGTLSRCPHLPGRAVRRHRRGLRPAVLDGTAADRGDPATDASSTGWALHATGRQPRGSGQGPDCFGTSTAWSCGQCISPCGSSGHCCWASTC